MDEVLPVPRRASLIAGAPIRPIIPTTIEEAFRLAQAVVAAGLAPDSYNADNGAPDPQKILIGILKSIEVGLPPITGLSTIAIVRKRPCVWGDGAVALVQRSGLVTRIDQFYEGEETAEREVAPTDFPDSYTAIFRIWRDGQDTPYEGRFSVRDAKRAHLWLNQRKQPWIEYPKRMLMARARAFALREGFADALSGLSIREELEDLPPEAPTAPDLHFLETPARKEMVLDAGERRPAEPPAPDNAPPPLVGGEPETPGPTSERKEIADDGVGHSMSGRVSDAEQTWWSGAAATGKYRMIVQARNAGTTGRDRMIARISAAPTKDALVAFIASNTTALQQIHLVSPAAAEEVREAMARKAQEFGE